MKDASEIPISSPPPQIEGVVRLDFAKWEGNPAEVQKLLSMLPEEGLLTLHTYLNPHGDEGKTLEQSVLERCERGDVFMRVEMPSPGLLIKHPKAKHMMRFTIPWLTSREKPNLDHGGASDAHWLQYPNVAYSWVYCLPRRIRKNIYEPVDQELREDFLIARKAAANDNDRELVTSVFRFRWRVLFVRCWLLWIRDLSYKLYAALGISALIRWFLSL